MPAPPREREPVADSGHWLEGRLALVTGASRGIGAATAEALGAAGVRDKFFYRHKVGYKTLKEAKQAAEQIPHGRDD